MKLFSEKRVLISGGSEVLVSLLQSGWLSEGASVAILAKRLSLIQNCRALSIVLRTRSRRRGRALPIITDVRDEAQVKAAVSQAADAFGGLDICINNASAISLTNTAKTEMKRFDLMFAVNVRATFMLSREALPHLLKSDNPHILNISPPLDMQTKWFAPSGGVHPSKFGMSQCVLGMAGEFKSKGIAVNALWPHSVIATAAISNVVASNIAFPLAESRDHGGCRSRNPGKAVAGIQVTSVSMMYCLLLKRFQHLSRGSEQTSFWSDFSPR